jgi:TonB family protein
MTVFSQRQCKNVQGQRSEVMRGFLLLLALTAIAAAQEPAKRIITVEKYVPPQYPMIAKYARISDDVVLALTVASNGEVVGAKVQSGHRMLQNAALESVKQWRFHCFPCWAGFEHAVTYRFLADLERDQPDKIEYAFPSLVVVHTSGGPYTSDPRETTVCQRAGEWYEYLNPWVWIHPKHKLRGPLRCQSWTG